MPEALGDTGPILHLSEIGRLDALRVFTRIEIPEAVAAELERLGHGRLEQDLTLLQSILIVRAVPEVTRAAADASDLHLQPADREVLALARLGGFRVPVLSDDLALRQRLEAEGGTVVGSVGALIRSFTLGRSSRSQLEESIDHLMTRSTLHMSRAFRGYVLALLRELANP